MAVFFHPRLLEEETSKRAELEQLHLQQQRALSQTKAEKQELVAMQLTKDRDLQAARLQLDKLESEQQEALEKYKVRSHMEFYTYLRTGRDFIYKVIRVWKLCLGSRKF